MVKRRVLFLLGLCLRSIFVLACVSGADWVLVHLKDEEVGGRKKEEEG